ncbi:hypothetical protein Tco_1398922 [Tanacetum coccineum]
MGNNEATKRAYAIRREGANLDSNVFTVLRLMFPPSTLDTSYVVELVDGRVSKTIIIFKGCTLGLLGHPFDIDLMPVELGSFYVIISMDWLAKSEVMIVIIEERIISCTKAQKCIEKGC